MLETPNPIEKIKFPEVAQLLERMRIEDQEMRMSEEWDSEVDSKNTQEMKRIIGSIGWPTISKVGVAASHDAWLLVQHADRDPSFQFDCLELMKAESSKEVDIRDVAYLEDRVRVNTRQLQLYGTQMDEERNENGEIIAYFPQPIEDPEHIDERRATVGMGPHAEYVREIIKENYPDLLKD